MITYITEHYPPGDGDAKNGSGAGETAETAPSRAPGRKGIAVVGGGGTVGAVVLKFALDLGLPTQRDLLLVAAASAAVASSHATLRLATGQSSRLLASSRDSFIAEWISIATIWGVVWSLSIGSPHSMAQWLLVAFQAVLLGLFYVFVQSCVREELCAWTIPSVTSLVLGWRVGHRTVREILRVWNVHAVLRGVLHAGRRLAGSIGLAGATILVLVAMLFVAIGSTALGLTSDPAPERPSQSVTDPHTEVPSIETDENSGEPTVPKSAPTSTTTPRGQVVPSNPTFTG